MAQGTRIGVVGAGYVGLTTAACFAHLGFDVVCADIDAEKIARLAKAEVDILEDGLPELVEEGLDARRLRFVVGASEAARDANFVFLCVQTPAGDDGVPNLETATAAVREIAPVLDEEAIVLIKSTMPVGATRLVARVLSEAGAPPGVGVVSNPEFLREGHAVHDFIHPARVVLGSDDPAIAVRAGGLYEGFVCPVLVTGPASAEMIKYASNAFLATKISFVNAIANLCEGTGAEINEVALGMGYDPRIGSEFLHAGPGYGGSCFPKDTSALLHTAGQVGYDFQLLRAVVATNRAQHEHVVAKVLSASTRPSGDRIVAAWGLTFKANTDDLRESPAVAIVARLSAEGATVRAYDPAGGAAAGRMLEGVDVVPDPYVVCAGADVLVVLTEWDEFRWLDLSRVAASMRERAIVDARNILDPATCRGLGFTYQGIGR
jgi:UDPglucose 6-dehydrogenase